MQTHTGRLAAITVILGLAGAAAGGSYVNDFDGGSVGADAVLLAGASIQGGAVELTPDAPGRIGTLQIMPTETVSGFTATFDFRFQTGVGSSADGIAFVLGAVPGAIGESGVADGLTVQFDLYNFEGGGSTAAGVAVRYDGAVLASDPSALDHADAGVYRPVTIRLDADGTLDVWYDGAPVFADLPTGHTPDPGDDFAIGGRTGAGFAEQRVDNVAIQVNGPTIVNTATGTPYAQIKDAVNASFPGDVIEVGAGTIVERDIAFENRHVTVRGAGPGATVVDGDGVVGSIVKIFDGDTSTIEGLTLRNGVADIPNGGGGAYIFGTTAAPTFVDCRFESNGSGGEPYGAVYAEQSRPAFIRCAFVGNSGEGGAAAHIGVLGAGHLTAIQCLFAGGFDAENSVHLQEVGTLDPTGFFLNCTFADYSGQSHVRVIGAGASAAVTGCVFDGSPSNTPLWVTNGAVLTANSRNVSPGATGDNIDGEPTFVDGANGDYRLAPGSLGIDAADWDAYADAGGGLLDLAGASRFADDPGTPNTGLGASTLLDCGAYEFQGSSPPPAACPGDLDGDGDTDLSDFGRFAADFGCVPTP